MVNARLCETTRLAFFFARPRHFDLFYYETETLKHLAIKINGEGLRRFGRSSVIVGQDVGSGICMDVYSCREVRVCGNC